jgi:predicted dithiol-disulfide oxidoreductase (DUF899 family)
VRIDKEYRFETDEGSASLADLLRGRSQVLIYHFMFDFEGFVVQHANHDVLCAVSRAPLAKLQGNKRRMGSSFPWASSYGSEVNYVFRVSFTAGQQQSESIEYNFGAVDMRLGLEADKGGPDRRVRSQGRQPVARPGTARAKRAGDPSPLSQGWIRRDDDYESQMRFPTSLDKELIGWRPSPDET